MTDQMLHTPDGVRDIYNGECKQKLLLQERLHDVLRQYGYRDIQTPTSVSYTHLTLPTNSRV